MGTTAAEGWRESEAVVAELVRQGVTWRFRERDVPAYVLPDVLALGGKRVTTREEWERGGRGATLEEFAREMFGRMPGKPEQVRCEVVWSDPAAMDGAATGRGVRITAVDGGKRYAFEAACYVPNGARGPVPAFLLINNREVEFADPRRRTKTGFWPAEEIVRRGYATAVVHTEAVDPDADGAEARAKGVRGVWAGPGREGEDGWATIAAWAWGACRVMDYLETEPGIDARRVALVGHSRGGKAALWAGAVDERFAMVASNESGCGGAALARREYGETIEIINGKFPYWFCGNFQRYNGREGERAVDQHQLLALIAPRLLYVGAADQDLWADPRGMFLALAAAGPVYGLYGQPGLGAGEMPGLDVPVERGHMGFHVRRGEHDLTLWDWERLMDFADRHLGTPLPE